MQRFKTFTEAEEFLNRSLELNPNLHIAYSNMIPTFAFQGKFLQAQEAFKIWHGIEPKINEHSKPFSANLAFKKSPIVPK